jgi:regulator of RNase E activity RraA
MVIGELDIPAYHHRAASPTNLTLHEAIDINVPVGCGDVAVFPGDIVVGDDDSVIIIPADIVDDVAAEAFEMTAYEDFVVEQVKAGATIIGLYPATDESNLTKFAAWRKTNNR